MAEVDLRKVPARVTEIDRQLEVLKKERDELTTTLRVLERLGYRIENCEQFTVEREPGSPLTVVSARTEPLNRFEGMSQAEASQAVLQQKKEPMRAAEIRDTLVAGGFPHKDVGRLKNNLFTCMSRRSDVFTKIESGLWALVEWDTDESDNEAAANAMFDAIDPETGTPSVLR